MNRHVRDIIDYCHGVLDDSIVAGRLVKLACQRHLDDLDHAEKRGYVWDHTKAAEGCEFFETCLEFSKAEWSGQPFVLTPPQKFINGSVFGWVHKDSGLRRFRRAYVDVGRKFGKSEQSAGIALKHGACDDPPEPGAQVYLAATKEEQIRDTSWKQCTAMAKQRGLAGLFDCQNRVLMVNSGLQPGSVVRIIGSDRPFAGLDLHAAILDEIHDWLKRHLPFYESMTSASGSRRQPIIWYFTTHGDDTSTLWISLVDEMTRMLEECAAGNPIQDHLFAFIATIDEDDDPMSFDSWCPELEHMLQKANPNWPITPKPGYLQQQWEDARDNPIETNKFLRFHANKRVRGAMRPILPTMWAALPRHSEEMPQWPARGAFDLGRSEDFAAWAVGWREGERYRFISRSYTCEKRRKELHTAQIDQWISEGWMIEHPGNSVIFDEFENDILAIKNVIAWAFDPQFAGQLGQHIETERGEDAAIKYWQGFKWYNEPTRKLLRLIKDCDMEVQDDPCLAWQMSNMAVKRGPQDMWMPDKSEELGKDFKVDAAASLIMCLGLLILNETEATPTLTWM